MSGNVFEDLPGPSEPPAAFFGNSRSPASAQCEPVSLNTGRVADRTNESERYTYVEICKEVFNLDPPPQNCMVEQQRNQASDMHFDKSPGLSTFPCWKTSFKTEVWSCSIFPTEIQKHEFQADYDRRNIQKLNEVIGSQREETNRALQGDEELRRDQQLLHEQLLEQNR